MATIRFRTRKRDGVVVAEVRFRRNGKQESVSVEGELTAQRYFEDVEHAEAIGAPIPPPPDIRRQRQPEAMTVGEFFLGPYRRVCWPGLAPGTHEKYESCWNRHVCSPEYGVAVRTLSELDENPALVTEMKNAMRAAGRSNATINNTLGLLGGIFTLAVQTAGSGMKHHPMRSGAVTYVSTNPDEPPVPQAPMVVAMVMAAFPDDQLLDAWSSCLYLGLGLGSGARPGEVRALEVPDFRERTVRIVKAIGADGKPGPIKNEKWHYPPVQPLVREDVLAYGDGRRVVFPTMQPKDAHRSWTKRVFKPARDSVAAEHPEFVDLDKATPYDLGRHSFAAVHLAGGYAGDRRYVLARWLGHDTRTLERHYGELIAEHENREAEVDAPAELARAWEWLRAQRGR
jgi:integrase